MRHELWLGWEGTTPYCLHPWGPIPGNWAVSVLLGNQLDRSALEKSSWDQCFLEKHQIHHLLEQIEQFLWGYFCPEESRAGGARHISFKERNAEGEKKEDSPRPAHRPRRSTSCQARLSPPVRPPLPTFSCPALRASGHLWLLPRCVLFHPPPAPPSADVHLLWASIVINKWCPDWLENWFFLRRQPWPLISEILLPATITQISFCTETLAERVSPRKARTLNLESAKEGSSPGAAPDSVQVIQFSEPQFACQ